MTQVMGWEMDAGSLAAIVWMIGLVVLGLLATTYGTDSRPQIGDDRRR